MKLKTFIIGAMFALGMGMGLNSDAMTLRQCCNALRQDCLAQGGSQASCNASYNRCVNSGYCVLP